MGTNYYATFDFCNECGRGNKVHIGKQSAGHRFLLRSYGSNPIQVDGKPYPCMTGADWIMLLVSARPTIEDEFGYSMSLMFFLHKILYGTLFNEYTIPIDNDAMIEDRDCFILWDREFQ